MEESTSSESRIYSREQMYFLRKKMENVPYLLPDGMEVLVEHEPWRADSCSSEKQSIQGQYQKRTQISWKPKNVRNFVPLPTLSEILAGDENFKTAYAIRKRDDESTYENSWAHFYLHQNEALILLGNQIKKKLKDVLMPTPLFEDRSGGNGIPQNSGWEVKQQPRRPLLENKGKSQSWVKNTPHAFDGQSRKKDEIMKFWKSDNTNFSEITRRFSDEENRIPSLGSDDRMKEREVVRTRKESRRASEVSISSDSAFFTPRESPVPPELFVDTSNHEQPVFPQRCSDSSRSSMDSSVTLPGLFTNAARSLRKDSQSDVNSRCGSTSSDGRQTAIPRENVGELQVPVRNVWTTQFKRPPPLLSQDDIRLLKFSTLFSVHPVLPSHILPYINK